MAAEIHVRLIIQLVMLFSSCANPPARLKKRFLSIINQTWISGAVAKRHQCLQSIKYTIYKSICESNEKPATNTGFPILQDNIEYCFVFREVFHVAVPEVSLQQEAELKLNSLHSSAVTKTLRVGVEEQHQTHQQSHVFIILKEMG